MNPDELLEILKKTASPKTKQTLDAIHEVCFEQQQRGLTDFSVATIARLGAKRDVPRAQTMRNKTGDKYRALLRAFEDATASNKPRQVVKSENDWIDEIDNIKLQLLARSQASELLAAKKLLRELVPPGMRVEVRDYHNEIKETERPLDDLERRALEYLISDQFLKKWHFAVSEYGEIVDRNNNVVLRPATVNAIKKALAHL